jgi:hypothetical protein
MQEASVDEVDAVFKRDLREFLSSENVACDGGRLFSVLFNVTEVDGDLPVKASAYQVISQSVQEVAVPAVDVDANADRDAVCRHFDVVQDATICTLATHPESSSVVSLGWSVERYLDGCKAMVRQPFESFPSKEQTVADHPMSERTLRLLGDSGQATPEFLQQLEFNQWLSAKPGDAEVGLGMKPVLGERDDRIKILGREPTVRVLLETVGAAQIAGDRGRDGQAHAATRASLAVRILDESSFIKGRRNQVPS